MSRRKAEWVGVDGRDKGRRYVLEEPAATLSEAMALRVFLAAARSGLEIPDSVKELGIVGLAVYGIELIGKLPYDDALAAADFLMACVKINEGALVRDLEEDDVEEVATRLKLKREVLTLITGFTWGDVASSLGRPPTPPPTAGSPTT